MTIPDPTTTPLHQLRRWAHRAVADGCVLLYRGRPKYGWNTTDPRSWAGILHKAAHGKFNATFALIEPTAAPAPARPITQESPPA